VSAVSPASLLDRPVDIGFAPPLAMRDYGAFGGTLRSAIDFPELGERIAGSPDWTLHAVNGAPSLCDATPLGERKVGGETYRLAAIPGGLRLEYSHAGTFDIVDGGSSIHWYCVRDTQLELVRAIVLGPVLALALEASGHFCLHGSAVAFGDRAVGFLAPKHHGKSTLAVALAAAGARFVGDDTLAVRPGSPAILRPGIGSVRLWRDAAIALRVGLLCDTVIPGVKITAAGFHEPIVQRQALPLAAIYVLDPVVIDAEPRGDGTWPAGGPTTRHRLNPAAAAVSLAHHTKLPDSLVGIRVAATRLRGAASIAATVPVFSLRIARDFARLPEAVQQLFAWHSADATDVAPEPATRTASERRS
jgi:hypothetical protein